MRFGGQIDELAGDLAGVWLIGIPQCPAPR